MKKLLLFASLALFCFFAACEKAPTFADNYKGHWVCTLDGDLLGKSLGFEIYDEPGSGAGSFSLSFGNIINEYKLETNVTATGQLKFDFYLGTEYAGSLVGSLDENGTGNGNYEIYFLDPNNSTVYKFTGTWSAERQ